MCACVRFAVQVLLVHGRDLGVRCSQRFERRGWFVGCVMGLCCPPTHPDCRYAIMNCGRCTNHTPPCHPALTHPLAPARPSELQVCHGELRPLRGPAVARPPAQPSHFHYTHSLFHPPTLSAGMPW